MLEAPSEERARTDLSGGQTVRQSLAQETGVNRRTLHRDAAFADAVDALTDAVGDGGRWTG